MINLVPRAFPPTFKGKALGTRLRNDMQFPASITMCSYVLSVINIELNKFFHGHSFTIKFSSFFKLFLPTFFFISGMISVETRTKDQAKAAREF